MKFNDFSSTQQVCIRALNQLPNHMGSVGAIKRQVGAGMMHVAITSAMLALIRKDNIKPFEESRWIVRLPPRDKFGAASYAMTKELIELMEQHENHQKIKG